MHMYVHICRDEYKEQPFHASQFKYDAVSLTATNFHEFSVSLSASNFETNYDLSGSNQFVLKVIISCNIYYTPNGNLLYIIVTVRASAILYAFYKNKSLTIKTKSRDFGFYAVFCVLNLF